MVRILRKLNLWVIFFTLLSYLAPMVSPSVMSLLMFAGLAYPWLMVANVIFVLLWGLSRMRHWWWSAVVVVMGLGYFTSVFGVHYFGQDYENDPTKKLKVLSYNLGDFVFPYSKNDDIALASLNTFLEKQNADVLCIQEFFSGYMPNGLSRKESLSVLAQYPYFVMGSESLGAIFSRFPIVASQTMDIKKLVNGGAFADINVGNRIVRVYNFHLASNKVSGIADRLSKKGKVTDDDSWLSFGRMLALVRRKGVIREKEAAYIKSHIQTSPYPVVVCGDFNDIPISYTYSILSDGLTDAFAATGKGFGTTYNGKIPALKIDYILSSPSLEPIDCQILRVKYSDHYPIISQLRLEK